MRTWDPQLRSGTRGEVREQGLVKKVGRVEGKEERSTRLLGTGVRRGGVTRETEALTRAAPRPVKTHDPIDALF